MSLRRSQSAVRGFVVVAGVGAASLAWVVPVFMLPFVHVLPYLQSASIWHRVAVSATFYLAVAVIAGWALTERQRKEVGSFTIRGPKDKVGIGLGLLMAIFVSASLSANTFGLLVLLLPGEEGVRDFVVVKSTSGRKATELQVASKHHQIFEVSLSKRIFSEIPPIYPGDKIRFKSTENLFGTYVTSFDVHK